MTDIRFTSEDEQARLADKSLQFTFTQQLGRPLSPIRGEVTAKAAGKVILVGEHAVVYGARAIALPLLSRTMNLRIYTDRQLTMQPRVKFQISGKPASAQLVELILEAFEVLGISPFNVSIDGSSTLMLGAGVGSSASLCVGILRGLTQVCGVTMTPAKLSQLANKLERRFHGNPSGLDTAVISLEQAILFEKGRDATAISVNKPQGSNLPWCFALLDTGIRSPTIDMVRLAEPWFLARGAAVVEDFNAITDQAAQALHEGNVPMLAQAMSQCHAKLDEAGVVTPPVTHLVERAIEQGAVAAKVTGAGGGGCILALFAAANCDRAIAALRQDVGKDRIHPLFIP